MRVLVGSGSVFHLYICGLPLLILLSDKFNEPTQPAFAAPEINPPNCLKGIDFSEAPKSLAILGGAVSNFVHTVFMSNTLPNQNITAILAGGQARRFGGQDKGEILIEGQRMIDIICSRLAEQGSKNMISGRHDYRLGLDVVTDADNAPGGPVGGIYSIWRSLEGHGIEGFFTVPIDGPNLPRDLLTSLYSKTSSTIASDEKGRHPTYGWWRMVDLSRVWKMTYLSESISLNRLADLVEAKVVHWEGNAAFTNINTPDDFAVL